MTPVGATKNNTSFISAIWAQAQNSGSLKCLSLERLPTKAFCHRNEINAAYKSNLKTTKNVPLPPPFSNPSLMFYMKIAFIFLGMEKLVVPGIKHTKINTSVIICTLSSVFKIHAGWDVLNLEMRALCWWWSRPNRNFRCSPNIIFCSGHLTHSHGPPYAE